MSGVKIQKVDHVAPVVSVTRHKSMRTYPRGAMKGTRSKRIGGRDAIVPVKDPAKPPPARNRTLRILTEKGAKMRRKTIKQAVQGMSDAKVVEKLRDSGVAVNPKTPKHLLKEILEGGMEAGMIVAK
jgi:hypothetical protein